MSSVPSHALFSMAASKKHREDRESVIFFFALTIILHYNAFLSFMALFWVCFGFCQTLLILF